MELRKGVCSLCSESKVFIPSDAEQFRTCLVEIVQDKYGNDENVSYFVYFLCCLIAYGSFRRSRTRLHYVHYAASSCKKPMTFERQLKRLKGRIQMKNIAGFVIVKIM